MIINNLALGINFRNNSTCRFNKKNVETNSQNNSNIVPYPQGFSRAMSNISFKGWMPRHPENVDKFNQITDLIKSEDVQTIAISGHSSPDGDSIASSIAMANLINIATGKKVNVFVFGDFPKKYRFLDRNPNVQIESIYSNKDYKKDKLMAKYGQFDLALSMDTPLTRMIPDNYLEGIFNNAKNTARIDHHPYMESYNSKKGITINSDYAQINLFDEKSDSAAQLVMQFAQSFGIEPEDLKGTFSDCIYTGIVTDTNNFAYARSADSFEDATLLIRNGVSNKNVQSNVFGNIPKVVLDARKHIYDILQYSQNGEIAYFVEDEKLEKIKQTAKQEGYKDEVAAEIANILEELIRVEGIEIAIKMANNCFSVRSKNVDISKVAEKFAGGGHKNAAAFSVSKEMQQQGNAVNTVIDEYTKFLESN